MRAGGIVKSSSDSTDESNALDVKIMIPERANGSRKSKETENITQVESNGCQSIIVQVDVHASMNLEES